MNTKEIPHNLDAEQAVLGSMFMSKYALQRAVEVLNKNLFYLDANGRIFDVLAHLLEKNIPVDITTVSEELRKRNILREK